MKIQPGDRVRVQEGTLTFQALTNQQRIAQYIDSPLFGVSYFGMSIPILQQGSPTGCVTAILPSKPKKSMPPFVPVKTEDHWLPIPFEQIHYLETQNRKTFVKSEKGSGFHKHTLNEFEWYLPEDCFIRCHRSYIANIHFISEIYPDSHSTFLLIMKDKTKIPVSQGYASYFRKMLSF
ncbi:LytTR family DNA-binding domain-containing protein [Ammoniphilus sp. 3BR4]|uniref:LytTR family DNA-binding domain-containing protein n=1 Tax=Ammoniphilus sp. 3BR4 TaxID=3158265 RepID=UPI003466D65A